MGRVAAGVKCELYNYLNDYQNLWFSKDFFCEARDINSFGYYGVHVLGCSVYRLIFDFLKFEQNPKRLKVFRGLPPTFFIE